MGVAAGVCVGCVWFVGVCLSFVVLVLFFSIFLYDGFIASSGGQWACECVHLALDLVGVLDAVVGYMVVSGGFMVVWGMCVFRPSGAVV